MSFSAYDKFNIWFPALVGGLVIGFLSAAFWDLGRRRIWLITSRFWPGVLEEVGLNNPYLSHAVAAEVYYREISETLSGFASQINFLVSANSPEASLADSSATESSPSSSSSVSSNSGATSAYDIEAQGEIDRLPGTPVPHTHSNCTSIQNPMCPGTTPQGVVTPEQHSSPVASTVTAFFPDGTSNDVIRPAKRLFKSHASGPVNRVKSSIILQATLLIDPCVLAEIGELAKKCMSVEKRCTFQLGNWAILYYNADKVHLHILKEGDVPVNVEARLQDERWFNFSGTRITMRGLYLTGAEVKAGTQRTSIIFKSAGPATQGLGDLEELDVTTKGLDAPREDLLIYASKLVERADGVSLIVRSDARFILPPLGKFPLIAFMAFISMTFPLFGALLVFCNDFAFTPTTSFKVLCFIYLLCFIWTCIMKPKRLSFSWISKWVIITVGVLLMVVVFIGGLWVGLSHNIVNQPKTFPFEHWDNPPLMSPNLSPLGDWDNPLCMYPCELRELKELRESRELRERVKGVKGVKVKGAMQVMGVTRSMEATEATEATEAKEAKETTEVMEAMEVEFTLTGTWEEWEEWELKGATGATGATEATEVAEAVEATEVVEVRGARGAREVTGVAGGN